MKLTILLGVVVSFVFSAPNGMGSDSNHAVNASTNHFSEDLHPTGAHSNKSIAIESNNQTVQATKSDSRQTENGDKIVEKKESVKSELKSTPTAHSTINITQSTLEMNIDKSKEPSSNSSETKTENTINANSAASTPKSDKINQQEEPKTKMNKATIEISKPQEQKTTTLSRKVMKAFVSLLNLGDAEEIIIKDLRKHKFTCLALETKNQMNVMMQQCEARWHPESTVTNTVVNSSQEHGSGQHPQFTTKQLDKNGKPISNTVNKEVRKSDVISKNDLKKKAIERKEKGDATNKSASNNTLKNFTEKNKTLSSTKDRNVATDDNKVKKYIQQVKNFQQMLDIGMEVAKFLNDGEDDEESNNSFGNQHPSNKKTGNKNPSNHRFDGEKQGYYQSDVTAKKSNAKKKTVEDGDSIQVGAKTNEENPSSGQKNIKKKSKKNKNDEVGKPLLTANTDEGAEITAELETAQPTLKKKKKKLNTATGNRKGSPNENDFNDDELPKRGIDQQDKTTSFRKRAVDNQPKQEDVHVHETKLALCFLTSMMGNIDSNRSSVEQLRKEIERSHLLLEKKNLAKRDFDLCITDVSTKEHNNFFHLLKEVGCFVKAMGQNGCEDNRGN